MLVDMEHCHLFDKETEMTIVARDAEAKKVYLENKKEEAEKAAAAAEAGEAAPAAEPAPAEEPKGKKNIFKDLFKKKKKPEETEEAEISEEEKKDE